jgi:hypothetical protein
MAFAKQIQINETKVDMKKYKFNDQFKFLSGSNMWIQFDIKDDSGFEKSIHYFGDRHNLDGVCPQYLNCKTTTTRIPRRTGLRKRDYDFFPSPCYDFLYFLEKMFEDAYENKVYMDLFLEYPYNILKKINGTDDLQIQDSYLKLIYEKFHNCFTLQKKNCKYSPYVRVHYTDLRLSYNALDRVVSSTEIITDIINDFLENIDFNNLPDQKQFSDSFLFVNDLYEFNLDYGYKIFEILMTKYNFDRPILDLYQILESKISKLSPNPDLNRLIKTYRQYIQDLLSLYKTRNNKKVFIAKHQLDELRKDNVSFNGKNVVDLITKNILDTRQIVKEQYENEIEKIWSSKVVEEYNYLIQNWSKENMKIFLKLISESNLQMSEIAISIDAIMLDSYIMPRMFRKYTSYPSSLTFVLAGTAHIQFEVDFMKNVLGYKPLHEIYRVEGTKQCLYYKDFWKIFDIRNYESANIKYYHLLTVQQIKNILKEREIRGYSNSNKDKLISVLRDDDKDSKSTKPIKYEKITKAQLVQEFKRRNIKGYSGKKKKELIDILNK